MSIWSFTQSDGQVEKGTQKYKRNNVYKACGIIIFLSIATIGILGIIKARKPGKETTASHTCCNTICGNYDEKMVSPASDSCQLYATCYKELLGTLLNKPDEEEDYYTFLFETISLFAFGFSWFVKGETLWKDKGN